MDLLNKYLDEIFGKYDGEFTPPQKLPTLRMSFDKFFRGDYKGDEYNLYIIWKGKQALYVGISTVHVMSRWFGDLSPHIHITRNGEWLPAFSSLIGQVVIHNRPQSMKWTVELRHYRNWVRGENLNTAEANLIAKLRPLFNTTYRGDYTEQERVLVGKLRGG
jgi:hypothetical protein